MRERKIDRRRRSENGRDGRVGDDENARHCNCLPDRAQQKAIVEPASDGRVRSHVQPPCTSGSDRGDPRCSRNSRIARGGHVRSTAAFAGRLFAISNIAIGFSPRSLSSEVAMRRTYGRGGCGVDTWEKPGVRAVAFALLNRGHV